MGVILSILKPSSENAYEKILADLDDKIQKIEVRLSDIKVRERKFVLIFLIYSLFAYGLYLVTYFVCLRDSLDDFYVWLCKLVPAFLIPVIIYYVSRGVSYWYNRKRLNEETQLETLKVQQRQKIEELKKKTAYYSTKNLLDRYDSPVKPKSGERKEGSQASLHNNKLAGAYGKPTAPNLVPANPKLSRPQDTPIDSTPFSALVPHYPNARSKSYKPSGTTASHLFAPRAFNQKSSWYDKIVDAIVGEEGPNFKYALICNNCFAHNGLALPNEIDEIQYHCPKCNFLNPSRHLGSPHTQAPKIKASKPLPRVQQVFTNTTIPTSTETITNTTTTKLTTAIETWKRKDNLVDGQDSETEPEIPELTQNGKDKPTSLDKEEPKFRT